jgi:hypothetical protein
MKGDPCRSRGATAWLDKRVVNGETTDIWGRPLDLGALWCEADHSERGGDPSLVSHLLLDNGSWDETFIHHRFLWIDAEAILR